MTLKRMEHIGIVVDDLAAATAFFGELGLELKGEMTVEGSSVDRIIGLEGARSEIAMMRAPDGSGEIELIRFLSPASQGDAHPVPPNTRGLRHLAFAVEDIEAVVTALRAHGGELVGEVVNYEDSWLLCYVRGPEGIIVELAEKLG
jgi:catechol 2,3-dioxygenase-like lactoylglutathione lyase family enzyme